MAMYDRNTGEQLTPEEEAAALAAGRDYTGSGTPADATSVTRDRTRPAPTDLFTAALTRPEGSTTDNRGITGYSSSGESPAEQVAAKPTPPSPPVAVPEPAAEIFKSMLRTGQEVGGSSQLFRGATSAGKRSSMADALRIGDKAATTRTATPRTISRKKKQNILGLNISPGIGLQV